MQVPPDAEAGTYWGIIFFESGPAQERQEGGGIGIRVRTRVGHVVYVDVGRVVRSGRIQGVRYQPLRAGRARSFAWSSRTRATGSCA